MSTDWLEGTIRHRRKLPVLHDFTYKIGMIALDIDEWSTVTAASPFFSLERFNWMSLYRKDYLDPEVPSLRQAVYNRVKSSTGWAPDGPIELITHPRYLGYVFNPVSFYLCYEQDESPQKGDVPRVILAQITNTPWKERHVYCLESNGHEPVNRDGWHTQRFAFGKRFHVSPFNGMDQHYDWLFSFRGPELRVHMNVTQGQKKHFDATLVVQRTPFDRKVLHKSLMKFPLETLKGTAGIYWNALKLKTKGAPFYTNPDKLDQNARDYRKGADDQGIDITTVPATTTNDQEHAGRVSSWRT
ncbi:MAG: hypothetical protein HLUCCX14_03260 [Marinobacter excellens HL-55]|uniref:DUF1365 domain-containing protein n=1 Tax=Marinobacter excellens HL-55 TaxID=1305731 RepID=A0A0P8D300_9GAMM|nr:MAG: hypothetical protein HLUCCX14_03260 [Marinobacter excellens HL-55]